MNKVNINREPIELFKVLKFEGLASSGGEAKSFISDGLIIVNGSIETRKSKKMYAGDVIEFSQQRYTLALEL